MRLDFNFSAERMAGRALSWRFGSRDRTSRRVASTLTGDYKRYEISDDLYQE